jgi:hypothetical protein
MTLVTLASKGTKPFSGIPDYLASRVPLPPAPESISKVQAAPKVTHTSKQALLEIQRELEEFLRAKQSMPSAAPSDKAHYEISFYPVMMNEWPIGEKKIALVNGVANVAVTFMIKDHTAKQTRVWVRLCTGCRYAKEPVGLENLNPRGEDNDPHERTRVVGDILPGPIYPPVDLQVIPPPGSTAFMIGMEIGCDNCEPVTDKFKTLLVDIEQ